MKRLLLLVFSLISVVNYAQKEKSTKLGQISKAELELQVYEKDSTANAVVLYEHGNLYINRDRKYRFTTDYYFRVKILKKEGFDYATIKIPLYGGEKAHDIKAVTYNISNDEIQTNHLLKEKIFTNQINEKWREVTFTLSNIKVGSVLEYKYSITNPYSGIDDWYFQSDLPKVKSDFTAAILNNWRYHMKLVGFFKLTKNDQSIKQKCVYIPGMKSGSCLMLDFSMEDIPPFEEEDYMLSKENFISKVSFDLESYTDQHGIREKYTKTWGDVDKKFKTDLLSREKSDAKFFKKKALSDSILLNTNKLEKANQVFNFIKNHYSWNEKYLTSRKMEIKKAFNTKVGNVFDINLSLYSALKAADIESNLVLLATRAKGLPTKLFPVYNDFNYLIVKTVIDGNTYFLDATNKNHPFGLIQYDALNEDGRVLDYKEQSYWEDIKHSKKSSRITTLNLNYTEDGIEGDLKIFNDGYVALFKRDDLVGKNEDDILSDFETKNPDIEVEDFEIENLSSSNEKLIESYKIIIENVDSGSKKILINPFFISKVKENPFKLNERNYPVDYGYKRTSTYRLTLKIPTGYLVNKLPKNKSLSLPNNGGKLIFLAKEKENTINIFLRFLINKKAYSNEEYFYLKELYNQLIKIQDSYIEIQKK